MQMPSRRRSGSFGQRCWTRICARASPARRSRCAMRSWRSRFLEPGCRKVSKFLPLAAYDAASDGQYQLLPLKFTLLDGNRYVMTNMVGEYAVVSREVVHALARHTLRPSDPRY